MKRSVSSCKFAARTAFQKRSADSQVQKCKAQLEEAQLNLSNTIIRSPATGVVGKKRIEAGQNVKVGQELIDIVSLDDVWITANFEQSQLVHLIGIVHGRKYCCDHSVNTTCKLPARASFLATGQCSGDAVITGCW